MSWPQAQDYNEAIQNPRICFTDPDLRQATVKLNALGLPIAISGAFASVYQLDTPSGKWAVRCFVREVPDTRKRYLEISKMLKGLALPCTAPFEFQSAGIKVAGKAYPIVKMKWMGGKLIGDYVAENISNPGLIASLAQKWANMIKLLNQSQIAHGDLQHGNVLVVNHELMLIDYDGMFIPPLKGLRANELGHPDYHHPRRSEKDFGPHIDNFSSWIIYASLKILAEQPNLHSLARGLGRDEVLLFNREDYRSPAASPVLSHIKAMGDELTIKLCDKIIGFTSSNIADVPPLDTANFAVVKISVTDTMSAVGPSDWWKGHLKTEVGKASQTATSLPALQFGPQKKLVSEIFWLIILSAGSLFGLLFTGIVGGIGCFTVQLLIIFIFYNRLHNSFLGCVEVAARNRHLQEESFKMDALKDKRNALEGQNNRILEIQKIISSATSTVNTEIAFLTASQGAEIRKVHSETAVKRSEFEKAKRKLQEAFDQEVLGATRQLDTEVANIRRQIANVDQSRTTLITNELEEMRKSRLKDFLRSHSLYNAEIPGIGSTFKSRIMGNGMLSAADLEVNRLRCLEGFGYVRTKTVMDWKRNIADQYMHRLPASLSQSSLSSINASIQTKRSELEHQLVSASSSAQAAKRALENKYKPSFDSISAQEIAINSCSSVEITRINSIYGGKIAGKRTQHETIVRNLKREEAGLTVSSSSLKAEISKIDDWLKNEAPRITSTYAEISFSKFLCAIFKTP